MEASNETPPGGIPEPSDDELDEEEPFLVRRRERLLTPLTVLVGTCALLAVGIFGGVEIQKSYGGGGSASAAASSFAGFGRNGGTTTGATGATGAQGTNGGGRGFGGFGGFGGGATIGSVKAVDGTTLYVTDTQGNTVKVVTNSGSQYTKSDTGSFQDIHPGDTVVVRGQTAQDGTVTAETVAITAAGGSSAGSTGLPNLPGASSSSSSSGRGGGGGFPALPGAGG